MRQRTLRAAAGPWRHRSWPMGLQPGENGRGGQGRRRRRAEWLGGGRDRIFETQSSFFAWRRRGGVTEAGRPCCRAPLLAAGRWRSASCAAAPPGSHLCVRADAARLTTAGDAAERRWTRGPWTALGTRPPRRQRRATVHRCRCSFWLAPYLYLLACLDTDGGGLAWGMVIRPLRTLCPHGTRPLSTLILIENSLVLRYTAPWGGRSSAVFLAKSDETGPSNSHMTSNDVTGMTYCSGLTANPWQK